MTLIRAVLARYGSTVGWRADTFSIGILKVVPFCLLHLPLVVVYHALVHYHSIGGDRRL